MQGRQYFRCASFHGIFVRQEASPSPCPSLPLGLQAYWPIALQLDPRSPLLPTPLALLRLVLYFPLSAALPVYPHPCTPLLLYPSTPLLL